MDPNKLKDVAIKKGILDKDGAQRMSDADAYNLIFAPGFSTKTRFQIFPAVGWGWTWLRPTSPNSMVL